MFVVVQRLLVDKENTEKVIAGLADREMITEQEGFVDLSILKAEEDENDKDVIGVIGRWKSREAWSKWEESPDRDKVANVDKNLIADMQVDLFESSQILTSK